MRKKPKRVIEEYNEYLKEKLKSIEALSTTRDTWRDVAASWQATLALLKTIEAERGRALRVRFAGKQGPAMAP